MMMMEAIRLSLASEEERRKKAEKEAKKEAKRREKESKKAEKAARKHGFYSNNASSSALDVPSDARLGRVTSSSSSITGEDTSPGKGKEVDRASPPAAAAPSQSNTEIASDSMIINPHPNLVEQGSSAQPSMAQPSPREPPKPSHLRQVSSASSSFSSLVESTGEDHSGAYDGNASSTEPMFNFRSLAAVIGDEDKGDETAEHVEDTSSKPSAEGSASSAAPVANEMSGQSTAPADPIAVGTVAEDRDCLMPKELETRSVEITSATRNAEATT
jgi:hypothetical protein